MEFFYYFLVMMLDIDSLLKFKIYTKYTLFTILKKNLSKDKCKIVKIQFYFI